MLRRYLLWLEPTHHNPGGVHGCYRTLKTFLLWYEAENEPERWKNPIHQIKAPKLSKESLAPVELEDGAMTDRHCQSTASRPPGGRCEFDCLRGRSGVALCRILVHLISCGIQPAETAWCLGEIGLP